MHLAECESTGCLRIRSTSDQYERAAGVVDTSGATLLESRLMGEALRRQRFAEPFQAPGEIQLPSVAKAWRRLQSFHRAFVQLVLSVMASTPSRCTRA
jgi:hypothetical protein